MSQKINTVNEEPVVGINKQSLQVLVKSFTWSQKNLLNGRFIKVTEIDYQVFNLPRMKYEKIETPDTAHVILFDEDMSEDIYIILVSQIRVPVLVNQDRNNRDRTPVLELCAGSIPVGVTPEDCIVKEIKEELGYIVQEEDLIKKNTFVSAVGSSGHTSHYYSCGVNKENKVSPELERSEFLSEVRIRISEIPKYINDPMIKMDPGTAFMLMEVYSKYTINALKNNFNPKQES